MVVRWCTMGVARLDEDGYVSDKLRVKMKVVLRIAGSSIKDNFKSRERNLRIKTPAPLPHLLVSTGGSSQGEYCVREPVKYGQRSQSD